jgi:hypothetical protein
MTTTLTAARKSLFKAVVVAAALGAPVLSHAQESDSPADSALYSERVQAADAHVGAQDGAATSVGGMAGGSSLSGARPAQSDDGMKPLFFGR